MHPSKFISDVVFQNNASHGIGLGRDVANFCNSLTAKSEIVTNRLETITGKKIGWPSSFVYLSDILDRMAHGFIAKEKKWCAQCYRESMEIKRPESEAKVADELYWSLAISQYCAKHLCSLSYCCGVCYQRQPFISNKYEPGFCHYCGTSLTKAPHIICDLDGHSQAEAESYLAKMDIFIPGATEISQFDLKILSRNLRGLVDKGGADGLNTLAECFGINNMTLKDWCSYRHGVSVESLAKIVDGLQLPRMSLLFGRLEDLLQSVGYLTKQFNFNVKKDLRVHLPDISRYLNETLAGKREPEARSEIAKKFGVSTGMLENAFREELKSVSKLYEKLKMDRRKRIKSSLQYKMNLAVQRCASKKRPLDWPHIMAELKSTDFLGISQRQLNLAKEKAIKRYCESTRRGCSRNVPKQSRKT
ncbi:hypothetical protein ACJJH9_18020 [Microbulbifer sp. DLAB2-AF]|uniref:hypothetical protein n=1 Tax=Microbulbifer sp. DLAB2-AF TaxID=3243395 RepID=UPI00403A4FC7